MHEVATQYRMECNFILVSSLFSVLSQRKAGVRGVARCAARSQRRRPPEKRLAVANSAPPVSGSECVPRTLIMPCWVFTRGQHGRDACRTARAVRDPVPSVDAKKPVVRQEEEEVYTYGIQ